MTLITSRPLVGRPLAFAITACVSQSLLGAPAIAHVTFQTQTMALGGNAKAVLRVPNGCSGAPTTALCSETPEGLVAQKQSAPLLKLAQAQPAPSHGHHGHGTHAPSAVPPATPAASGTVYTLKSLVIEQPWSRETPSGARVAGGFFKITNKGPETDHLIGGTFPLAGRFEVHEMAVVDGVMRMRELDKGLEIKPGQTVELKPGSFHVMFMDLKEGLKAGQSIKGTLVFAKSGTIEVEYSVAPRTETSKGSGTGHKH